MDDEIPNKELKVWLESEFKAVKEEIRGVDARLSEWINGLDARLELIQWGMAIFIAPLMIPLVDLFRQASMGRGVFSILGQARGTQSSGARSRASVDDSGRCFDHKVKNIDNKD